MCPLLLGCYLPATSFRVTAGRQLCRFSTGEASPLSVRNHVVDGRRFGGGEFRNCSWPRMISSNAKRSLGATSAGNFAADRFHFTSQSEPSHSRRCANELRSAAGVSAMVVSIFSPAFRPRARWKPAASNAARFAVEQV